MVPKLQEAKIRGVVTVVPSSSAIARISTPSWQAEVVGSITMKDVSSLKEAETFISELKKIT